MLEFFANDLLYVIIPFLIPNTLAIIQLLGFLRVVTDPRLTGTDLIAHHFVDTVVKDILCLKKLQKFSQTLY